MSIKRMVSGVRATSGAFAEATVLEVPNGTAVRAKVTAETWGNPVDLFLTLSQARALQKVLADVTEATSE